MAEDSERPSDQLETGKIPISGDDPMITPSTYRGKIGKQTGEKVQFSLARALGWITGRGRDGPLNESIHEKW